MIGLQERKVEGNTERKYREEKLVIKVERRRERKSLMYFQTAKFDTFSGRR